MRFSSVNILLIFVQIFHHHLIFAQDDLSDQEVEEFYEDLNRARQVQTPRRGKAERMRKKLPGGDTFNDPAADYQTLECGSSYDIAQLGYIFFKLHSKNEPCHLSFIGSKAQNCTTAFICNGEINLETSAFPDDDCDREWLILSDGTGGIKKGCHSFSMGDYPRIPRNPGSSDIYVYYKGKPDAPCVAFCMEDLQDVHRVGIRNRAFRLSKEKGYKGLKKAACMCGKQNIQGRIVGGEEAKKFEFPWMVAIVAKGERFMRRPFCGGSLINDRYIVSAAHCFYPWNVRPYHVDVVLHMHVADKAKEDSPIYEENIPGWDLPPATDEEENSLRLEVEEIINHPLFYEPTYYQDIALLKLKEPLDLRQMKQRGIGPICLPSLGTPLYFQEGDRLTTSGWGRVNESIEVGARPLQKVDVLYHDLNVCKKYAGPSDTHICAGYMEGGKDACQGDSGGPLTYQFKPADHQHLLAGIVSAGEGCARPTKLGYYTNVEDLIQWILKNTQDAIWCYKYLY